MYPERHKSAEVKKEMRAFHQLVGRDDDADDLLLSALGQARYRVVVKRPRKAPLLAQREPSYQLSGKTTRFRSEEHTSELQSRGHLVCRLLLEKKNNKAR